MLENDIKYAQRFIIGMNYKVDRDKVFNQKSFIYRKTTENISLYKDFLRNRERILSVTASGDQVLNSILFDSYNIDTFDISDFPKYFLRLKIAAVLSLNKDDFIKFFVNPSYKYEEYLYDLYCLIRKNLDKSDKKFWDSLFNFFDINEVYESFLFNHDLYSDEVVVSSNPYLEEDNYLLLKEKINKANINYYSEDIKILEEKLNSIYDLINLSNIINYEKNYKKILNNLPLSENGEAITYLYNIKDNLRREFPACDFITSDKGNIMIYKRK